MRQAHIKQSGLAQSVRRRMFRCHKGCLITLSSNVARVSQVHLRRGSVPPLRALLPRRGRRGPLPREVLVARPCLRSAVPAADAGPVACELQRCRCCALWTVFSGSPMDINRCGHRWCTRTSKPRRAFPPSSSRSSSSPGSGSERSSSATSSSVPSSTVTPAPDPPSNAAHHPQSSGFEALNRWCPRSIHRHQSHQDDDEALMS